MKDAELAQLRREHANLSAALEGERAELRAIRNSVSWRITAPLRRVHETVGLARRRAFGGVVTRDVPGSDGPAAGDYAAWINEFDTVTDADRAALRSRIRRLARRPLISVLMPVFNTPEPWLRRALDSVRAQIYEQWELCVADDASTAGHVRTILEHYRALDPRIKIVFRPQNGHISAASNSALALAKGEYVALLDHDDELREHALAAAAIEIDREPASALIYSDEDKIDADERRFDPYFKPDWNPDLFRSQNYVCHLGIYRTSIVRDVGGFREGFEGSQDYDLALRVAERISEEHIRHIPEVLYHWRSVPGSTAANASAKQYAHDAARRALVEHLSRTGRSGDVLPAVDGAYHRICYGLPAEPPLVSLIVPTRDGLYLMSSIESIRERTTYPHYEILVINNQSQDPDMLGYLRALEDDGRTTVLTYDHSFNHSAIINFGVRHASGSVLCLLADDVEVITPRWLEELLGHALRPEIGAVGAKLLYPDGRIQHAGVVLGIGGVAGHAHRHLDRASAGYGARAALTQNYQAVTGACLLVRRAAYEQVGGFDEENLPSSFNDVDFCLRLVQAGYRNVWTPYAELFLRESSTGGRGGDDPETRGRFLKDIAYMKARWGSTLRDDPSYNPNLTLEVEDFGLAWPRRYEPAWRAGRALERQRWRPWLSRRRRKPRTLPAQLQE